MNLQDKIKDILDFPRERESYEEYMDIHTLGGEFECYHMTDEGKEKLATQILDLLDKSLVAPSGQAAPRDDGKGYYYDGYHQGIADVRKVIKEEL